MSSSINFSNLSEVILKGVGQIMLQESKWTGLFFCIGLFIGKWEMGVACLLATISGTCAAYLLKFKKENIDAGLYGFSPALVGVVLLFLFQPTLLIWSLVIVGGGLAALIQHLFIKFNLPGYTFPFIVVAWGFIFILKNYFTLNPSTSSDFLSISLPFENFWAIFKGFGQVIFQGKIISGILFFIGVFIHDQKAAIYGLIASLLGILLAFLISQPVDLIQLGVFGFNGVLTAIALSSLKQHAVYWALFGVLLTIAIDFWLTNSQLLTNVGGKLTFPFVAGTWVILILKGMIYSKKKITE